MIHPYAEAYKNAAEFAPGTDYEGNDLPPFAVTCEHCGRRGPDIDGTWTDGIVLEDDYNGWYPVAMKHGWTIGDEKACIALCPEDAGGDLLEGRPTGAMIIEREAEINPSALDVEVTVSDGTTAERMRLRDLLTANAGLSLNEIARLFNELADEGGSIIGGGAAALFTIALAPKGE